uniref:Uncharacterized protein n=1 Tax=Rhizophora mucronata TaxID=61149 RepID=A0A2P2PND2_RHIMU
MPCHDFYRFRIPAYGLVLIIRCLHLGPVHICKGSG